MNRRNFLVTAGAGVLVTQFAGAESKVAAKGKESANTEKLQSEASNCLEAANACLEHCDKLIAAGDNSMKDCRVSVVNLIAVVGALKKVSAENSAPRKLIRQLAKVCGEYCKYCEAECKPHVKHDICKKCLESCQSCRSACESFA